MHAEMKGVRRRETTRREEKRRERGERERINRYSRASNKDDSFCAKRSRARDAKPTGRRSRIVPLHPSGSSSF